MSDTTDDDIDTNFDSIFGDDASAIEYESVIEFELGDENHYESLIYSITNDNWKVWYLDDEGEEYEEYYTMEEFKALQSLTIYTVVLDESQLLEYLGVVLLNRKEKS